MELAIVKVLERVSPAVLDIETVPTAVGALEAGPLRREVSVEDLAVGTLGLAVLVNHFGRG